MSDMKPVPLFDLTRQWSDVEHDVRAALERVFANQQYILGGEVAGLEQECAAYLGVKRADRRVLRHRRAAGRPDGARHRARATR